jgi:hypothetical protein
MGLYSILEFCLPLWQGGGGGNLRIKVIPPYAVLVFSKGHPAGYWFLDNSNGWAASEKMGACSWEKPLFFSPHLAHFVKSVPHPWQPYTLGLLR